MQANSESGAENYMEKPELNIINNANKLPRASHTGPLFIGDLKLNCAVLEDGTRILSERSITGALGGKRGGSHWVRVKDAENYLPVFLSAANLTPFIPASLAMALGQPVKYRGKSGKGAAANGVLATLLPEICDVWINARHAGALKPQQEHIARAAEILQSGLAKVGIIALVDEATGYQEVRDRHDLERILEAFIRKELLPWTKRFPDEFYQEMFRLRGWPYSPVSPKRPSLVGKLTNQLVYEKLPPGVLENLQKRNPVIKDGRRRHRHHQFLTEDIGNPTLEKHLSGVIALMRASKSWSGFKKLFDRAYGDEPQLEMDMGDDED